MSVGLLIQLPNFSEPNILSDFNGYVSRGELISREFDILGRHVEALKVASAWGAATNAVTRWWCGRGDSNPHPLTGSRFSYHFDFRRRR